MPDNQMKSGLINFKQNGQKGKKALQQIKRIIS